jgi:glycosyltransferase involved in cell wall biosynthesis
VNVLCLTKYTVQGPSSRYRVHQFLPHLAKAGIHVEIQALHDEAYLERTFRGERPSLSYLLRRACIRLIRLAGSRRFDVIFIQKEIFPYVPDVVESLLAVSGAKLVVDLDDAVFLAYRNVRTPLAGALLRGKFPRILRRATLVLAGNRYLKAYCEQFCERVVLFPTVVDAKRFVPRARTRDNVPVVGWIGSPTTIRYLRGLSPLLERVAASDRFRLAIVGADAIRVPGLDVTSKPWSEATEAEDLATFDIGLMPLDTSEWARGKCGLKLLQYMGAGIPSVASRPGTAGEIIEHGVNGYLADTPAEWESVLRTLVRNPGERAAVGRRARSWIESNYNLDRFGPVLASHLIAASGRG